MANIFTKLIVKTTDILASRSMKILIHTLEKILLVKDDRI